MKTSELRKISVSELPARLLALQEEQAALHLRKQLSGDGREVRTHKYRAIRREIAQIKTILNEQKRNS